MRLQLRPTANNFFLTVVSARGRTLLWTSCGRLGYGGPRRSTPLAAELAARSVVRRLQRGRIRWVDVQLRGLLGSRSRAALRGLSHRRLLSVRLLRPQVPVAHNGVRPAGRRRV